MKEQKERMVSGLAVPREWKKVWMMIHPTWRNKFPSHGEHPQRWLQASAGRMGCKLDHHVPPRKRTERRRSSLRRLSAFKEARPDTRSLTEGNAKDNIASSVLCLGLELSAKRKQKHRGLVYSRDLQYRRS